MEINKVQINGESIYLKKSKLFGWGVIHPNRNEDNSINWKNLLIGGSWLKLFILIIIILIILGVAFEYMTNLSICQRVIDQVNIQNNIQNIQHSILGR